MIVRVTEVDIARGKPDHSCECPVALAVLAMGYDVEVGVWSIEIWKDGRCIDDVDLPQSAVAFIYDFDSGRPVSPFEFELQTEHLNMDINE